MRIHKIATIPNYSNKIVFRGSDYQRSSYSGDVNGSENNNSDDNNIKKSKPLPEWARKGMLFTLVFFTLKNEPFVQNIFDSHMLTEEELDRDEFFEDVQSIRKENEKSPAFFHLNSLYDIEQPKIEALGYNHYLLEFNLDNQQIKMEMNIDKENKDLITGNVRLGEDNKIIDYKAKFDPDNVEEFKLVLNDGKKKYLLGRDYNGELYKIENNKKEILNKNNVEKYEQYMENLETLDDLRFFTNDNPLWKKLNYLLLIILVYAEYRHDKMRQKQQEQDSDNQSQV